MIDPNKMTKSEMVDEYKSVLDAMHSFMDENHNLTTERDELREALADLVFQCEEHPMIQTDRAKAVLDETK